MLQQKEFLREVKNAVLSFDDKAEVILYGSRARGDFQEDSDWDVLTITSFKLSNQTKDALQTEIYDIELKYSQAVSVMIVDRAYWDYWEILPLFQNVAKEGVMVRKQRKRN